MSAPTRYARILEQLFFDHYEEGDSEVAFDRAEISRVADQLGIDVPKNLGDVVYSSRYRTPMPESVREKASEGDTWVIFPAGKGRYRFGQVPEELVNITPRKGLSETKVPDATPGMVAKYSLSDEQALLVRLRYNRLIDVFTGVTCYPLQSHLRATVPDMGQVETDELYVGVDRRDRHYVFPVQAKGGNDYLGIVQIVQDLGLCADKFPSLICRPIGAQFLQDDLIVLFEFEEGERYVTVASEKHYRLVLPDEISPEDLEPYRTRPPDG